MSFTLSQLKEIADKRTERRASKLDLDSEILLANQEVCQFSRWWWRRKTVKFDTVAGQSEYDLSALSAGDFQQFTGGSKQSRSGVRLFDADGNCVSALHPEFDVDEQDKAIVTASTKQGTPCRYFMKPGAYRTVILTPTPSSVWTFLGSYWAVPEATPDSQLETIPLLPSWMHIVLLTRLEARINRYTLGEGSALYQTAIAEYTAQISKAASYNQFAEGESRESNPGAHGDAIQSSC